MTSQDTPYHAIDAYLAQQLRRLGVPGGALVIVEGERITHARGFGRTGPGGDAPTPQTPFFIGSTGKSITALAVMQLVEAGRIALDEPVQRTLPWFRTADAQSSGRMTVRHLLHQTSGLSVWPGWALLGDMDDRPDAARRQAQGLAAIKLKRAPGEAFEYSNLNYNLLGLVVEAASGEAYGDYVRRHIFEPLGMRHSYTAPAEAAADGPAVGHQSWFGFPVPAPDLPVPRGSLAAGQHISCAKDMGRYLIAHLQGGRCSDAQVLSAAGMAELHRPAASAVMWGADAGAYGMGWYVAEQAGTPIVSHSGIVPNFYAYMALLPAQMKGLVLLVNAGHFMMNVTMSEVGNGAAALLAGQAAPPIRLGAVPWALRALLLVPLGQVAGVLMTLRLLRRWGREPARVPGGGRVWRRHILLPAVPHLLLALSLAPMLGGLRGFLRLFMPDVWWLSVVCGGFAAAWTVVRAGLILAAARRPDNPEAG